MSAPKSMIHFGLLAKIEATYADGIASSPATDAVQVAEIPEYTDTYAFDGARGPSPGTRGTQIRVAPNGKAGQIVAKIEGKGAASAFSGAVKPKDLTVMMRIAGFDETGSFTGGSEKYTYTPTQGPGGFSSGTLNLYKGGSRYKLQGCYADLEWNAENGGPGIFTFTAQGIQALAPLDNTSDPIAMVYAPTVLPPVSAPLVLTVAGVASLVVRSAKVKIQRGIQPRVDLNAAGGHAGFHPGTWAPELSFICEAPLRSLIDFDALRLAGTVFAGSIGRIGSTQYNRYKWTWAQMQVSNVVPQQDDKIPTLEVTCTAHTSTGILNDDLSLVID